MARTTKHKEAWAERKATQEPLDEVKPRRPLQTMRARIGWPRHHRRDRPVLWEFIIAHPRRIHMSRAPPTHARGTARRTMRV